MNNQTSRTVEELAALVDGKLTGEREIVIKRIASAVDADEESISFVEDAKHLAEAQASRAACLIVPIGARIEDKTFIETKHPKLAFARIAATLHPPKRRAPGIHPSAVIADDAEIGAGVFIGAFVCIGERSRIGAGTQIRAGAKIGDGVRVGENCVIHPNVFLEDGVTIGNRVILHAGVAIGADGFGYVRDGECGYVKFPQIGTVVIEDDVEIGANSCVDRGSLGETRIGRGTKLDNLVQIAHNVSVGARVVIAAQTGISGSTVIEDDCVIGGQVGMGDHARVERGAIIGSKAGVLPGKIVRGGRVYWGVPVRPLDEYKRLNALFGKLPQMREEINELRKKLDEIKTKSSGDI
jgi:UDP-3-O-[3-hydroxymyristoyl] glucosamine N-acyltransferase